jgi:hypothetical protein
LTQLIITSTVRQTKFLASPFLFSLDLKAKGTVGVTLAGITFISIGWLTFPAIGTKIPGSSQATPAGRLGASNQTGAVGGAAIGGYLLAAGGSPGVGYLCPGAVAFLVVVIVFFLREPARSL